jgi:acyl-coenzyme A synthetase/AMP-(fatty) acid ligase
VDSEDMLFILYTSGSTGKPKGRSAYPRRLHGVYRIYLPQCIPIPAGDIYWCTADIGWITGHSYIVYGPLLAGATSVMFEGIAYLTRMPGGFGKRHPAPQSQYFLHRAHGYPRAHGCR